MSSLLSKYGQWALITGASSGIGKEFATQLAEQGFNIVLVARGAEQLTKLAKELQSKYKIDTLCIPLDLTNSTAVTKLYEEVATLDIGLVIPAAGIDEMGEFIDKDYHSIERMLFLNIQSPTEIVHVFSQKMRTREHSAIILIASIFAYQGTPYFAAYAASKSYILALGETLNVEMARNGIDILVLSPGLTDTPFAQSLAMDLSKVPMTAQKPALVAETGLKNIGRKATVVSGLLNKFYVWQNRILPRSWPVKVFGFLIRRSIKSHSKKADLNT